MKLLWIWLTWVVLRINVALTIFQPYCDLEMRDTKSLKFKWRGLLLGPLALPLDLQAKSSINHFTTAALMWIWADPGLENVLWV